MSIELRLSPAQQRLREAVAAALASGGYAEREPPGPSRAFAVEVWAQLADVGALRLALPAAEEPALAATVVGEELGRALELTSYGDTLFACDLLARADRAHPLLDGVASGSCAIAVVAGGEARDGREATPLAVERRGRRYVVLGRAGFVGSALGATHLLVLGRDSSGSTLILLVPSDREGVAAERRDDVGRADLTTHVLAVEGDGSEVVHEGAIADEARLDAVARARVRQAAYLVGLAQGAFDVTLAYTRRRHAFGRQISTFQAVSFRLAATFAGIDPVRLLVQTTALRSDHGEEIARRSAQALALAAELALDTVAESLQLHGAYGLTEDSPIQRYYRRAAVEAVRLGRPAMLWDEAAARLAEELAAPVAVATG